MNKKIYLSIACALSLSAADVQLDTVSVEETVDTIKVANVSGEALKSGDLADSLTKASPSIALSRRSGIANDIVLRGQKRDNINVTIDGARIFGGCPNRMDPPISHVITNLIESVTIDEGPYDVENFGTLSGLVQVNTKQPSKDFQGEINLNAGSFDYKKASVSLSGGNEKVKVLFSASQESSGQYEDGNGDNFAKQVIKATDVATNRYQTKYEDMDAYEKKSFMGKVFINTADNQELRLNYTANRSTDVLYPSSPMDAEKDDSDMYSIGYTIKNLAQYSKKLDFLYYHTEVDHPMSTVYRNNSTGASGIVRNHMFSQVKGIRVKNSFDTESAHVTIGLDGSDRKWDGQYSKLNGTNVNKSIDNSLTKNRAIFTKVSKTIGQTDLKFGARYDKTDVSSDNTTEKNNSYNSLSANIFATYHADKTTDYFIGAGKSNRTPDGRELYFHGKDLTGATAGGQVGNPNLNQTTNYEIDLGMKKTYDNSMIKAKLFYSKLKDYIYFNSKVKPSFFNIDAKIYGLELSGSYLANDRLSFDYSATYQKGKKDTPLVGQSDTDLADIAPLRANISADFEYDSTTNIKLGMMASAKWNTIDSDNGEQELPGYAIANLKIDKEVGKNINLTIGVDNIFDKAYTTSNTYNDLTLVMAGGTTGSKVMTNEPGRYAYINFSYKF